MRDAIAVSSSNVLVTDAGAIVLALIDSEDRGREIRSRLAAPARCIASTHTPLEVLRTLWRYEQAGFLSGGELPLALAGFQALSIEWRGPERWLLSRVWSLRHNISVYDAPYVAIALQVNAPLLTVDERLARAAIARGVTVIVPGKT